MTDYYAGMVVRRYIANVPHILLVNSGCVDPRHQSRTKCKILTRVPGGSYKPGDKSPLFTALRELPEETGLTLTRHLVLPREIHRYYVPYSEHVKYFYVVQYEDCSGVLRDTWKMDGTDILTRPIWVPELQAIQRAYGQHGIAIAHSSANILRSNSDICLVG